MKFKQRWCSKTSQWHTFAGCHAPYRLALVTYIEVVQQDTSVLVAITYSILEVVQQDVAIGIHLLVVT